MDKLNKEELDQVSGGFTNEELDKLTKETQNLLHISQPLNKPFDPDDPDSSVSYSDLDEEHKIILFPIQKRI